jgi:hypothetical protein
MIPGAVVPYVLEEHDFTLQDLLEHLASKTRFACTLTESESWKGPVPVVRVETRMPLAIRIEDNPEADELGYLAEDGEGILPDEWIDVLLRCTAQLEVVEADFVQPEPNEAGVMEMDNYSNLDPTRPDIRAVLLEIGRFMNGYAYDSVNMRWIVPR